MNKKRLSIGCIAVVLLILVGIYAKINWIGSKPYKDLTVSEIESVETRIFPPGEEFVLTQKEIAELIPLLNELTIYERCDEIIYGQGINITLAKTDGAEISIGLNLPRVTVEGVVYNEEVSEGALNLSVYMNSLLSNPYE